MIPRESAVLATLAQHHGCVRFETCKFAHLGMTSNEITTCLALLESEGYLAFDGTVCWLTGKGLRLGLEVAAGMSFGAPGAGGECLYALFFVNRLTGEPARFDPMCFPAGGQDRTERLAGCMSIVECPNGMPENWEVQVLPVIGNPLCNHGGLQPWSLP